MTQTVRVWDGISISHVPKKEAAKLVKEDKAQNIEQFHGFDHFKFRKDFTGYQTRELRADAPPPPVVPAVKETAGEAEAQVVIDPVTDGAGDAETIANPIKWEDYKTKAKEDLSLQRITKAQVQAWMVQKGIS